jgi:drug/metabolite transporter (DMT)-like permease
VAAGIVLGLAGVAFLVEPGTGGESLDPLGTLVLCIAPIAWAWGSIWSRHADLPESPILAIGMEMLAGGALLLVLGLLVGESAQVHVAAISARSVAAWAYLTVFGALVGFTAYLWLLQVSTPAKVSTYAFVNPVVAVFLGWAFAHETVTPRTLIAAAAIIGAVALITFTRSEPE